MPPHSSHFLQPLDLFVFMKHKQLYKNIQKNSEEYQARTKFMSKILRICDSWEMINTSSVFTSWKRAGFRLEFIQEEHCHRFSISREKLIELIRQYCVN